MRLFAILLILIFQFVTSSFANTINWSSGSLTFVPSMCSGGDCSNDTLVTTGSFTVSGSALSIEKGCEGLTCVFTGHTIKASSIGLNIKSDFVKVYGGTFDWNGSSTADSSRMIKIQGHDVLLKNVSASIGGDNAICVYGNGSYNLYNVEIDGGTFWSEGTGYYNRCNYDAPVMKFENLYDETDPNFDYHVYIHNTTITDGPWAGITVLGRTNDGEDYHQALAYIDNNTITTDAQNDWYDHYSGQCLSSANPYGILLRHVKAGTRIYGNTITSGTSHGGNRGINLERGKGSVDNPVLIRKNTVNVHEGPNVEFGDDLPVHGLRVRYYNRYVLIDSNIVTVTMDSDVNTEHTGGWGQAFRISIERSNTYLTFRNNAITATALNANISTASGFVLDHVGYTNRISLYNNRITSSKAVYQFGEKNDQADNGNLLIYGDTVAFGGVNAGYQTFSFGFLCNSWLSYGNKARDVVYLGSTSPTDIEFSCGGTGTYSIAIERTLNLYARGNNGLPVSGATITAKNSYNQTVVSGTTGSNGLVSGVVTYHYEHNSAADSTGFNTFTLTTTKGGDSKVNAAFTVGHTEAGGTDTLTLDNTVGTGSWDDPSIMPLYQLHADSFLCDYTADIDSIRIRTTTYSQSTPDSIIITWSTTSQPDSAAGDRLALPFTSGSTDTSFIVQSVAEPDTLLVTAWVLDNDYGWSGRSITSLYLMAAPANNVPTVVSGAMSADSVVVDRYLNDSTLLACDFTDTDEPGVSAFAVTIKVKDTADTEYILVDARTNGNGGLTIVDNGSGSYTGSYYWNPDTTQILGTYDLSFRVSDGVDIAVDSFAANADELTIEDNAPNPLLAQAITIIDTDTTTMTFVVDYSDISGSMDSVWVLNGTSNPPTTHVDSSATSDPDTITITGLTAGTTYYLRTIATDTDNIDTSGVKFYTTLSSDETGDWIGCWNHSGANESTINLQHQQVGMVVIYAGTADSIQIDSMQWKVFCTGDTKPVKGGAYQLIDSLTTPWFTLLARTNEVDVNSTDSIYTLRFANPPTMLIGDTLLLAIHGDSSTAAGNALTVETYDSTGVGYFVEGGLIYDAGIPSVWESMSYIENRAVVGRAFWSIPTVTDDPDITVDVRIYIRGFKR